MHNKGRAMLPVGVGEDNASKLRKTNELHLAPALSAAEENSTSIYKEHKDSFIGSARLRD